MDRPGRFLPVLHWGLACDRHAPVGDGVAALIVTIMLIPQTLAAKRRQSISPDQELIGLEMANLDVFADRSLCTCRHPGGDAAGCQC